MISKSRLSFRISSIVRMSEEEAEKALRKEKFKVHESTKKREVIKKRSEAKDNPEDHLYQATALQSTGKAKVALEFLFLPRKLLELSDPERKEVLPTYHQSYLIH